MHAHSAIIMKHRKTLIKSAISFVLTAIVLVASHLCLMSCAHSKVDLTTIVKSDTYYVGRLNGKECMVLFTEVSPKEVAGKLYKVADDAVLRSTEFAGKFRGKKCVWKLPDGTVAWKKFSISGDTKEFQGEYADGRFEFKKYSSPSFPKIEKLKRYKEECFDIETIRDVKYGSAKGYWVSRVENSNDYAKIIGSGITQTLTKKNFDLYMDIYMPKGDTMKKRPLVLFIHGGGFFIGDKRDSPIILMCKHFAKMGYVVASINYRMGFKPAKSSIERCGYRAVQDAHAAMRFLVHNKEKYRIDPNYLFAAGSSAGGVTTLNLAFMNNSNRPESADGGLFTESLGNIESSGNSYKETFRLRCICNMWGAVHDINMIKNRKVSIISFHGDADQVVPYGTDVPFKDIKLNISKVFFNKMYGSKPIHEQAKKLGYRQELHTFKGYGHSPFADDNNRPTEKFYFIQEKTTDFFYKEFGSDNVQIVPSKGQRFGLNVNNVTQCSWRITGGFILSADKNSVRAVWLPDAPEHKLECAGRLQNGAGFSAEYVY